VLGREARGNAEAREPKLLGRDEPKPRALELVEMIPPPTGKTTSTTLGTPNM